MTSVLLVDTIKNSLDSADTVAFAGGIYAPGSVIQVQNTELVTSGSQSSTSGSHAAISGLSVNITPKSSNSKIWIQVRWCGEYGSNGAWNSMWGITRNGTLIGRTSTDGGVAGVYGLAPPTTSYGGANDNSSTMEAISYGYYDSPATTSQITYQATFMQNSTLTLYTNRTVSGAGDEYGTSSITVWEIAQ